MGLRARGLPRSIDDTDDGGPDMGKGRATGDGLGGEHQDIEALAGSRAVQRGTTTD